MAKRANARSKPEKAAPPAPPPQPEIPPPRTRPWLLIGLSAALIALFLIVYWLRLDRVVGLVVDDAWYTLLAKTLATGQGYTIVNSPTSGILPLYPPGFPALLSIFYRVYPTFPDNIWLLKSVSIAAMLGSGLVCFYYFSRRRAMPRYVALGIAATTAFDPGLVFLATSTVMSDCVFTLWQMLTLIAAEKCVQHKAARTVWRYALLCGVIASVAFLTRPMALGLLAGVGLYLLKERLFRAAIIYAATIALLAGPWMIYSRLHAPTSEQQAEQGGHIVYPYTTQFWQRQAGQVSSGTISANEIPERVWQNFSEITKHDIGAVAFYSFYRGIEPRDLVRIGEGGRNISILLSLLLLLGFIATVRARTTAAELAVPLSLVVTLLWGWAQDRLILPLVPFFVFYMLMGLRAIAQLYRKLYGEPKPQAGLGAMTVAVWLIVVSSLYANLQFIQRKYDPTPEYRLRWIMACDESETLMKYIGENVPKDAIIAAQNPALVHLYTGHKTISSDDPAGSWETWNKLGVRYLTLTGLPSSPNNESKYRTVHRVNGMYHLRLLDLGEPSSRPAWGK